MCVARGSGADPGGTAVRGHPAGTFNRQMKRCFLESQQTRTPTWHMWMPEHGKDRKVLLRAPHFPLTILSQALKCFAEQVDLYTPFISMGFLLCFFLLCVFNNFVYFFLKKNNKSKEMKLAKFCEQTECQ